MVYRCYSSGADKCRFFCGPNARKSDALAKQQRTRDEPKSGGAQHSDETDSLEEESQDGDPRLRLRKAKQSKSSKLQKGMSKAGPSTLASMKSLVDKSGAMLKDFPSYLSNVDASQECFPFTCVVTYHVLQMRVPCEQT